MPKGNPGRDHYKWKNGVGTHECGYLKVRVGRAHPYADVNGWVYLHRLVWLAAGREIPEGFIVHHINGEKSDNRLENLEIVSRSEHNRIHNKEKAIDCQTGRFVGKRAAGRLLDGREWSEFPEVRSVVG